MAGWALLLILSVGLLTGCPVPQPQDTPVSQTVEIDPVTGRRFWLYVPSTYRQDKAMPLIVTCHGTPPYDVAEHHIREWKMLAEKNSCIVVAPTLVATDGLLGDGPLVGMQADERFILSVISLLGYRYNIDRANIMITGFSGGGFPTYWVGLRNPDLFSVIVSRNGNFSQANTDGWFPAEAARVPVFVYYGENDPATIVNQSRRAITYLRGKGLDVTSKVLPDTGHERRPEVAMQFFREHWKPPRPSMSPSGG
jgi:poly(3-hydroxybutyrate) depolymerase